MYNDQPPEHRSQANKGHTKGVVLADKTGGLWLIHSVPNFPLLSSNYTYPRTGAEYGQSFLCISLDLKNLNAVGECTYKKIINVILFFMFRYTASVQSTRNILKKHTSHVKIVAVSFG